jgi:hypothetical protein
MKKRRLKIISEHYRFTRRAMFLTALKAEFNAAPISNLSETLIRKALEMRVKIRALNDLQNVGNIG